MVAGLEGVGVVADCVFKSFTELENNLDAQPKLSVIHGFRNGGLARIRMKLFSEFQFVEYVRELVSGSN